VAQALVRLVHQAAEAHRIVGAHGLGGGQGPLVLADHMTRAFQGHRLELAGAFLELLQADVTQGLDAEQLGGRLALGASFVICRIDEAPPRGRVQHDDDGTLRQGDGLRLERATVDEQRLAVDARRRDQLIHDPAVHTDPLVLGLLSEQGHFGGIPGQIGHRGEGTRRRHLDRGRGGKPRTEGDIPGDHAVEALEREPGVLQGQAVPLRYSIQLSLDFVPRASRSNSCVSSKSREVTTTRRSGAGAVRSTPRVDGHREDEAVVVIGMLADQVHPAGRPHDESRRRPVARTKRLRHSVLERHGVLAPLLPRPCRPRPRRHARPWQGHRGGL